MEADVLIMGGGMATWAVCGAIMAGPESS